ncbi:CbtA family protein [Streptomyces sp. A73]|uniref:CbtA family protein n=1 Tax=unclassified Streptomyces TaxID=2593676 RepID=UPI001B364AEE|nr:MULTISPECIES: CbtA family protein [unclassified Streptomyces]MBQ0862897.1 CbtA family protein [Streptomyces sp. RK75]MBQ1122546.1 CbtA family protein [Streptomyces sp. B15]MBQ1160419.1 CbtA family protein [Streptomyces sp. A73]
MSVSAQPTPYPLLPLLGRGLAAGGIAGLASGLFSLLLAEPLMDRAIRLEEKRSAAEAATAHAGASHSGHSHAAEAEELFSRGTQHLGLVVTAVVAGLAIGVFFTLAHVSSPSLRPGGAPNRSAPRDDGRGWQRSMGLAGAGFLALSLLPALRYPANPPGVGDGGTVTERQGLWLAALVIGVLGTVLAHQVHQRLGQAGHGLPVRQSGAAAAVVATLAALFLLPDNPDTVPVPATLLWDFRMLSLGGQVVLWGVLGAVFAAPSLRRQRSAPREQSAAPTA